MANETGRKPATFNSLHFDRLEKKPGRSNRWYYKCKYCGDLPNSCGAHIPSADYSNSAFSGFSPSPVSFTV
jgi:hypothetical protein